MRKWSVILTIMAVMGGGVYTATPVYAWSNQNQHQQSNQNQGKTLPNTGPSQDLAIFAVATATATTGYILVAKWRLRHHKA